MSLISVSECAKNNNNLVYINESLSDLFFKKEQCEFSSDKDIYFANFYVDDDLFPVAREEIADKIADVICVAYKYEYFEDEIMLGGLKSLDKEILLSSLISADIDDDKRYVKSVLNFGTKISLDGFYNFRIAPLRRKWREIIGYIPSYFTEGELKEFVSYLIGEKRGRKVYVENEKVYDRRYNRLKRSDLIPQGKGLKLVKEVLLSGAGEVLVKGKIPEKDEKYLKEYFGEKILLVHG